MAVQERHYTADSLWELSQGEDAKHYELDEAEALRVMREEATKQGLVEGVDFFITTSEMPE